MPLRARASVGNLSSGWPNNETLPSIRGNWPRMALSRVVLPAPLRPSRPTTSPAGTTRSTPWRMCDLPYQPCIALMASASKIGLLYGRVCHDGVRGIAGQNHSGAKHRDMVGRSQHDVHVVLDQHQGMAALQRVA